MAQSSYYAKLEKPELGGSKLVLQFGTAQFSAKKNTLSIATQLKSVKHFTYTWKSGASSEAHASGLVLRSTLSLCRTGSGPMIRVTRATLGAASSGASIWYDMAGW